MDALIISNFLLWGVVLCLVLVILAVVQLTRQAQAAPAGPTLTAALRQAPPAASYPHPRSGADRV